MEDLVDFTKLKKKRPAQQQNIINKFTETSELDDFVITKGPKKGAQADNKENISLTGNTKLENQGLDGLQEYDYGFLLERIKSMLKKDNRNIDSVRGPIKIPPPMIVRAGTTRSAWTNFTEVCTALNRPTDHLYQYILAELGTEGSLSGENQFMLKGKYTNKHVESLLRNYIKDYIQCINCKSYNTVLKKDNSARLQVLACGPCGSERTVQQIKAASKLQRK